MANTRDRLPAQGPAAQQPYIPPAPLLAAVLGVADLTTDHATIAVSTQGLYQLIAFALQHVDVDEIWYKETYVDVAAAIMAGEVASCREHFLRAGYFEGRLPHEPRVEEDWYLSRYPDVAEACGSGTIAGPQDHFVRAGYREGRARIPEHDAEADRWVTLARAVT